MHFLGTALIKKFGSLTQLCSTDNGIIDQKQLSVFD